MDELLQILKIEDAIIIANLNQIAKKDPALVKTMKSFVNKITKEEKDLAKIIKEGSHNYIFDKHNLNDVLSFGLHDYTKKTTKIGKHRSCYEKLAEEANRFPWIDFVFNYNKSIFEPKEKDAWRKAGKLIVGTNINLYGKSIDNQHKKDVDVSLDCLSRMLGKELKLEEKYVLNGPCKIRRIILNTGKGGIHVRTICEIDKAYKEFKEEGGDMRIIYGEEFVDVNSPLSLLARGISDGEELIFEFYGKGFQKPYDKINCVLNESIHKEIYGE